MGNCCRAQSCQQFFKPGVARRSLETYRKKGLDQLERQMIATVSAGALDGVRVLEIGGPISLFAAANSAGLHVAAGEHGAFWQWAALERAACARLVPSVRPARLEFALLDP